MFWLLLEYELTNHFTHADSTIRSATTVASHA